MAKGSEHFSWKLFGNPRRQCWKCGREPLRVEDVGEHRRKFPDTVDQFLCKTCQSENVQKAIRETRERMKQR